MTTIVTRAGKGAPLSWTEADANFTNLNTTKLESADLTAALVPYETQTHANATYLKQTDAATTYETKTNVATGLATKSDTATTVTKDSSTGAAHIPAGTSAQRPGSPTYGDQRANSTTNAMEWWNGSAWIQIADTTGVVTPTGTQTLTNKTLTIPVINTNINFSGSSGAIQVNGVDKVTIDSSGNLTVTGKVNQAAQSMVRLNTANGYGSTNTKIRRFTNTVTNQGTDITYTDSATLGASFTINTNGVYSISFTDQYNQIASSGLSLNTATPTTDIYSCAASEILASNTAGASGYQTMASWTGYLTAGSVIRAHTQGAASGANVNACQFTITRVS